MPDPAPSLAAAAAAQLPETGLGNPVTGVLLAFRSLDTLLETVVLFLALLGVWSLAGEGAWGGRPALRSGSAPGALDAAGAHPAADRAPVRRVRVLGGRERARAARSRPGPCSPPWACSSSSPASGICRARIGSGSARCCWRGPVLFTAIGFLGFAIADGFLTFPKAFAKPLILLIEAGLTLSIAVTLAYLVAGRPKRSGGGA